MRRLRGEHGGGSLVELLVATALAMILLAGVGLFAASAERTVTTDQVRLGAEATAEHAIATAVTQLSSAAQLGICASTSPASYMPLGECLTPAGSGPVIVAASDSGSDQGFCYYDYGAGQQGLFAPNLTCVVAYDDTTASDWLMYVVTYTPPSGSTYTDCPPTTCFGSESPSATGVLPPEPTSTSCTASCSAVLGATLAAAPNISFVDGSGSAVTLSQDTSARTLASIRSVSLQIVVHRPSFGGQGTYTYTTTSTISGAVYQAARQWGATP